jgi:ubiquinone/menaquinone biosynthesis C-methylase UbiE
MDSDRYATLAGKEAAHWGAVSADPLNPQIWEDDRLFDIFFRGEYDHMVARVSDNGPRVLELGCGNGGLALALAGRGLNVTAIDLSRERIARAIVDAKKRNLEGSVEFLVGDLNVVPLPANSFECVVAHDALHHILRLDDLLRRASAALVPGGKLIVMDYVGMGRLRKLIASAMYAVIPTYQPYRAKFQLRRRFASFLASENAKRRSMTAGSSHLLNPDSPFEEISGKSIRTLIESRFHVEECFTFLPFWYYFAAKVRLPSGLRYGVGRVFRAVDDATVRVLPDSGSHIFIVAGRKEEGGNPSR